MAELIDRKELRKFPIRIDHYDKENGSLDFVLGIETVFEYIEYLPTIEAKPVVHAHWDKDRNCTNCGRTYMDIAIAVWEDFSESEGDIPSGCPYCGAQMDEGVKIPVISIEDVPKLAKEMEK